MVITAILGPNLTCDQTWDGPLAFRIELVRMKKKPPFFWDVRAIDECSEFDIIRHNQPSPRAAGNLSLSLCSLPATRSISSISNTMLPPLVLPPRPGPPPALSFSVVSAGREKDDEAPLPAGMSPPVIVPFATLPSLGRSPVRTAAENIRRVLVRDALRAGGGDSNVSASVVPTLPSLARYTRGTSVNQNSSSSLRPDLELESMIRRVQDPSQPHWWRFSAASSTSSTSIPDKPHSTLSYVLHDACTFYTCLRTRGGASIT
jgi:hypothetical protein